jgi:NADH:quinone reductase (non-electrogenic)
MEKKKIVILGAGFGGVYTAFHLESLLKKSDAFEIIIINRENYFVYQPMLAEVIGGSLGLLDSVSSLKKLIPKSKLYIREVQSIDLENKQVVLFPEFSHTSLAIKYDHLVIGLGNVTDFRGSPGLHEHALPFKNLADAIRIRNHLIDVIEAAAIEENPEQRKKLLTFVVGGGGFSGTEVVAELNDFVRKMAKNYDTIPEEEVRVVLVHRRDRLMEREINPSLSHYSERILRKRGVDILFNCQLESATPECAILSDQSRIPTYTVVSTVPSSPNPLLEKLPLEFQKGKIKTDRTLQALGRNDVWAIGDCAAIPLDESGKFCPPTAQFAVRQGKVLARNIVHAIEGKEKENFSFKALGMLGALGHHNAVAEFFGKIKMSGFLAWLAWRAIYWFKIPGIDRRIKIAFSWFLDMIIPPEAVQLHVSISQGIAQLHYEAGQIVFYEGDEGDYLYIIVKGQVEVCKEKDGTRVTIAKLGKGEFFGEKALLNEKKRSATIICSESTDLLAIRKNDFGALIANFDELREKLKKLDAERKVA